MCKFQPIDRKTWPRAQAFTYYTKIAPTSYSLTVTMNITTLRKELKKRDYKFFPAYLYVVAKAITKQAELRIGVQDEILGVWDYLNPVYPQFHEDDKTISLLWSEYTDSFSFFYNRYIDDIKKHGQSHGMLSSKGIPTPNSFVISCIPWFSFDSFSVHNHGIKDYYFPSFEAGKFIVQGDQIFMPLSITAHHATMDGYHLHVFLEELQRSMDNPLQWLDI